MNLTSLSAFPQCSLLEGYGKKRKTTEVNVIDLKATLALRNY